MIQVAIAANLIHSLCLLMHPTSVLCDRKECIPGTSSSYFQHRATNSIKLLLIDRHDNRKFATTF